MGRVQVALVNGVIVAEWFPLKSGTPIVGEGATVLEAIGSLVVHDRVVCIEPTDLVETRWSSASPTILRRE